MAFRIDVKDPEMGHIDISIEQSDESPFASIAFAMPGREWLCHWDVSEKFLRSLSRAALAMADQIHIDPAQGSAK